MLRGVDYVLHFGVGYRLSEEVARFDGCLQGVARDVHAVPPEIAADRNVVKAQGRSRIEREIGSYRSMRGDGQILFEDGFVIGVRDSERDGVSVGQVERVTDFFADYGFDVDGVAGAIDGTVGIDKGCEIGAAIGSKSIAIGSDNGGIGTVAGENPDILMSGSLRFSTHLHRERSEAVRAGFARGLKLLVRPQSDVRHLDRRACLAVGYIEVGFPG